METDTVTIGLILLLMQAEWMVRRRVATTDHCPVVAGNNAMTSMVALT